MINIVVLPFAVVVWLLVLLPSAAGAETAALEGLYGDSATYVVSRGGEPVGIHRLHFAGSAARLTVMAQTRATMSFFGIFDLPFIYDSQAVWQGGMLLTLSSSFRQGDNGENHWVRFDGSNYQTQKGARASPPLFPTNHWNSAVVRQRVLYNTLNGELVNVRISPMGEEILHIDGKPRAAKRYDVSGDLSISLWYDERGGWLRLQFHVLGGDYQFTYQHDEG